MGLFGRRSKYTALEPDEIFIDSENLPSFDRAHLEGKIERPLSTSMYRRVLAAVAFVVLVLITQAGYLMVVRGDEFAARAENNHLAQDLIVAERGRIVDRYGVALAENRSSTTTDARLIERAYPLKDSAAHLVGYVSYPKRDQNGFWYQDTMHGVVGAEYLFDELLSGKNGIEIVERKATGDTVSGSIVKSPQSGIDIELSIDAGLQNAMHDAIAERVRAAFKGGAGAVMDVYTGELLALVSYPSFNPETMSSGKPEAEVRGFVNDPRAPFLDRAVVGLYAPGSIVKPFIAAAALEEKVVTPETTFVSTGRLVLPNPFDPKNPSIFRDWRAHGAVDMRRAIAVSSDVYFYIVGGGFESQRGLGISAINAYAQKFGFGVHTGFPEEDEPTGTVPSPEWKAEIFDDPLWRVGDTYTTSIGQYGWQVTLLQSLRATAALANDGKLVTPSILKGVQGAYQDVPLKREHLQVAREGMRMAVTEGTAQALSFPEVRVAAKTGTAEVGTKKEESNSLIIGFFPYDKPRYAFAIILERAKAGTAVGAPAAMQNVMRWIIASRPEYITTPN